MDERSNLLRDLTVFRFSETSAQALSNLALVLVTVLVLYILTLIVQRQVRRWRARRARRRVTERVTEELRFPRHLRDMLERLTQISGLSDSDQLTRDAWAFEHAVQRLYDEDTEADVDAVSDLRELMHLNVRNPSLRTESTRQLVAEQPVRILAHVEGETLDLYCSLVEVNELYMLIHIPEDADIHAVLQADPRVRLVVWREHEGETQFRTRLEFVPNEGMALAHAQHAFRAEEPAKRSDLRLRVDIPLTWRYVEWDAVARLKAKPGQTIGARTGQGRLLDLGYNGAAFAAAEALAKGGLAQVRFALDQKPLHAMLEITSQEKSSAGWIHRGRIRGITHESRNRVYSFLSREQVARLRERGLLKHETKTEPAEPSPAGEGEPVPPKPE
jgi:hypothetical protein